MSSGEKILHLPLRDIQVVSDNWTLPSSLAVTSSGPPNKELVITHLLNKERLVSVFKMMGKWQEDSECIESSPSQCTPDKDQSGMNEESLATVDLESPPGSPKVKPHPVIPLPVKEPEQLFPTPNEATTDPKLAQLHDMFPEEDIEKLSNLLRVYGGDVTRAVDAMLSGQVPDVPQVRKFDCKDFFQKCKDKFLGSVNTHAIAKLLEIEKVIPGSLCFELEKTSNDEATEMLFLHVRDNSTLVTAHSLCDVMIKKEGYPKMKSLGQDMKGDLPECVANEQRKDHPVNIVPSLLHSAVSSGKINEIYTVVPKCRDMPGFDVDCLFHGRTPLQAAAESGHVDIVEKLVELGSDMSKTDGYGFTALHWAAFKGHVGVVAKLSELRCDLNKTNEKGLTALLIGAIMGHVDVVDKLVELGCDMNETDPDGSTALHWAATKNHVDVIAKLIKLGCDKNKSNNHGWTALHYAAGASHVDVVVKLIDLGCDVSQTDTTGKKVLHHAADHGRVDVVAKLVELGCNMDERDLYGNTPLHLAAIKGHVEVVTKLIELGCNVNATANVVAATALHMAASKGHVDVVAELVCRGMDVDRTTTNGKTALYLAAQEGHPNVVTKLIELGCDITKTSSEGLTALDIARSQAYS